MYIYIHIYIYIYRERENTSTICLVCDIVGGSPPCRPPPAASWPAPPPYTS